MVHERVTGAVSYVLRCLIFKSQPISKPSIKTTNEIKSQEKATIAS